MRLQCLNVRALNIHTFYFEFILVTSIHQIEQIVLRTESIVNKYPTKQYIHILNTSSNKPYWYGKARYLDPHVTFFYKTTHILYQQIYYNKDRVKSNEITQKG